MDIFSGIRGVMADLLLFKINSRVELEFALPELNSTKLDYGELS